MTGPTHALMLQPSVILETWNAAQVTAHPGCEDRLGVSAFHGRDPSTLHRPPTSSPPQRPSHTTAGGAWGAGGRTHDEAHEGEDGGGDHAGQHPGGHQVVHRVAAQHAQAVRLLRNRHGAQLGCKGAAHPPCSPAPGCGRHPGVWAGGRHRFQAPHCTLRLFPVSEGTPSHLPLTASAPGQLWVRGLAVAAVTGLPSCKGGATLAH